MSKIGGNNPPVVISNGKKSNELKAEYFYIDNQWDEKMLKENENYIVNEVLWHKQYFNHQNVFPLYRSIESFLGDNKQSEKLNFIYISNHKLATNDIKSLNNKNNIVFVLVTGHMNGFADQRAAFFKLMNASSKIPVIIKRSYSESELEDLQIKAASDTGSLFLDGMGDGIWIENEGTVAEENIVNTSFGILQAARVRTSKTEYISCPGCGRTLFDLQKTTKLIRERTSHLKNLKIGIMGCIVNGPGEMADADYGYVGAGPGKITLYKNKEIIKKNIPEDKAVDELIQLIKDCGDWI